MCMREALIAAALLAVLGAAAARAESPNLGQPITEADIKGWDLSVLPDGTGLPPGSGTAAQGAKVFAEKCAVCHGENGHDGPNQMLIGHGPELADNIDANKTIANFWEYSTTLFDYIRRAMPWPQPHTLTDDEVYSLTAYILAGNKIIGEADVMNAQTLPKVRMPNRDGFIIRFPDKI